MTLLTIATGVSIAGLIIGLMFYYVSDKIEQKQEQTVAGAKSRPQLDDSTIKTETTATFQPLIQKVYYYPVEDVLYTTDQSIANAVSRYDEKGVRRILLPSNNSELIYIGDL